VIYSLLRAKLIEFYRLGKGEVAEEPWEIVLGDSDQGDGNCNAGDPGRESIYIAIKRRRSTRKRNHISKVTLSFSLSVP
jgi:hypothetical protein